MSAGKQLRGTLSGQASILNELVAQILEPHLAQNGISLSAFELLTCVKSASPGTPQAEIARRLGITPPSLTEAVRLAVRAGLLEQSASDTDKRSKTLALTPLGTKRLRGILAAVNEAEETMVKNIRAQDLKTAVDVLQAANTNLARQISVKDQTAK